jgi:hypothetical protein
MRQLSIAAQTPDQTRTEPTTPNPAGRWQRIQPARRRLARLSIGKLLRAVDSPAASKGATDHELVRLIGPLGHLKAEDVRWDMIGAAHTGRRYRI